MRLRLFAAFLIIAGCGPAARPTPEVMPEVAAELETSKPAFKINQIVMVSGKTQARIVDIARNGIWILRSATDGEWVRTGLEQIRERVSAKTLTAA